nr:MAG: RNA-dependent RNA polymerase [Leptosphaeria biglobosa narnavirus 7]
MSLLDEQFALPSECHPSLNGWFDPDFGLGDVGGKPLPVDYTTELANEKLAKYGFGPINNDDLNIVERTIASEVGDDEIEVSNSKASVALNLVFSGLLGMKESEKDTCINTRYGNFCEELVVLPDGYDQTYQKVKNTSSYEDMSFIDIPKLRLAINIRPMRMEHSSTKDGKAGMVGSRLKWLPRSNPLKAVYELFSLFQDVNLGLNADKKFAYLPTELGGYGKPLAFGNPVNLEKFARSFKNGAHSPVIRTIIRRANRFMDKTSMGKRPEPDLLLSHVSRFSTSFHDWVKGHSIYAKTAWIDIPPGLEEFQVGELGLSPVNDDIFSRLIAENLLVTESKLQVVVEHNHLCQALIGADSIVEFKRTRELAMKEWRNLSVFGQETYGIIKEIMPDQTDFRPLSTNDVRWFFKQVEERKGLLKTLFRHEPVYRREAIDHVYKEGPMFVPFNLQPRNKIGGIQFVNQTRFREDFVDSDLQKAENAALEWVSNGLKGPVPREIINDDHAIVEIASKTTGGLCIVTDDVALCKRANRVTKTPIFRVPCEWYYRCVYFGENPSPWLDFLKKRTSIDWSQAEDTGSLASCEENFFHDGVMLKTRRRMPFSLTKRMGVKDKSLIEESENYSDDPPGHPDSYMFDMYGLCSRRYRRTFAQ